MLRRLCLAFAALLSLAHATAVTNAEGWPDHVVRVIVPYPPGGGGDGTARVVTQKLGEILKQTFVIENRAGASGMVGASTVAHSVPDGYTLLICSPAEIALAPHLFKTMSYDPLKDLQPISLIGWTPLVIAANPAFPAATPDKLIELMKSQATNYAHPGIGSSQHLTMEYIKSLEGAQSTPVVYKGGAPALSDTISGQVDFIIIGLPPTVPFLKSGALKGIAVTSKKRSPLFPDLPALAETKGLENIDTTNWFGILAPKGTPAAIVERLHKAVVEALQDDKVRHLLEAQALEIVGDTPAEFSAFIRAESDKYGKIIEITGVKAEN